MNARSGPDDVLQEVYLQVFRRMGTFEDRGENSFLSWVYAIVDNKLSDAIRRARRKVRDVARGRTHRTQFFLGSVRAGLCTLGDSQPGGEARRSARCPDDMPRRFVRRSSARDPASFLGWTVGGRSRCSPGSIGGRGRRAHEEESGSVAQVYGSYGRVHSRRLSTGTIRLVTGASRLAPFPVQPRLRDQPGDPPPHRCRSQPDRVRHFGERHGPASGDWDHDTPLAGPRVQGSVHGVSPSLARSLGGSAGCIH